MPPYPRESTSGSAAPTPTLPMLTGVTWVKGTHLTAGDIVPCEIVAAEGYDLMAQAPSVPPPKRRKPRPMPRRKPAGSSLAILQ